MYIHMYIHTKQRAHKHTQFELWLEFGDFMITLLHPTLNRVLETGFVCVFWCASVCVWVSVCVCMFESHSSSTGANKRKDS